MNSEGRDVVDLLTECLTDDDTILFCLLVANGFGETARLGFTTFLFPSHHSTIFFKLFKMFKTFF